MQRMTLPVIFLKNYCVKTVHKIEYLDFNQMQWVIHSMNAFLSKFSKSSISKSLTSLSNSISMFSCCLWFVKFISCHMSVHFKTFIIHAQLLGFYLLLQSHERNSITTSHAGSTFIQSIIRESLFFFQPWFSGHVFWMHLYIDVTDGIPFEKKHCITKFVNVMQVFCLSKALSIHIYIYIYIYI